MDYVGPILAFIVSVAAIAFLIGEFAGENNPEDEENAKQWWVKNIGKFDEEMRSLSFVEQHKKILRERLWEKTEEPE